MTAEERESYAQNGTLPAWFRGTVGATGSDSQEYSLKTETMLVDAARESGNPNLRSIIFRQQFTQMTDIIDKTHRLYKAMGATYVGPPSWTWTFPSGAKIRLAYISTNNEIREYLGPRYSFIGFDESTFHSEFQDETCSGG